MNAEKIQAIFQKWVEITGVDPQAKEHKFTLSARNLDIHRANRDIESAIKHDPSGMTAAMLFGYHIGILFENTGFNLKQIMTKPEVFQKALQECQELSAMVYDEEIQGPIREFNERLIAAIQNYGAYDRDDVKKALDDIDLIALIRLSAVRSIDMLRVNQFTTGAPSATPLRYMTKVFGWGSVNALLNALRQIPDSFISVNLIRNLENPGRSYFTFAVKNGQQIFLVSDLYRGAHPMQDQMSRRPDRELGERIDRNLFPYELAGVEWRNSRSAYIHTDSNALVDAHTAAAMSDISALHPNEIIWLSMMFNLINDKFWTKEFQTPEISYTGAMMRVQHELEAGNLPALTGQEIIVPTLTASDMTKDNLKKHFKHGHGQHAWMEERYGHVVPDDVLNLTAENKQLLLPTASKEIEMLKYSNTLEVLNGESFGTAKELADDRVFLARYNQVRILAREAEKEFKETHEQVKHWLKEKLRANMDKLLEIIAHGDMTVGYKGDDMWGNEQEYKESFVRISYDSDTYYSYKYLLVNETQRVKYDWEYLCPVTGSKSAPIGAFFEPKIPEHLAFLCGCEVSDLPEVLQHWRFDELNGANHILDNVDPLDWAVHNPWIKNFDAKPRLYLSKSGYNAIRKKHGLPPNKFWESKAE